MNLEDDDLTPPSTNGHSDGGGSDNPQLGPGPAAHVGTGKALTRGFRKRCPRCGAKGIFKGWFELKKECPACGLKFDQEEGGYLGAMILNYVLAVVLWVIVLVVILIFTVPDVPVPETMAASAVVLIGVPIWFYPRSRAMWAAVEFVSS